MKWKNKFAYCPICKRIIGVHKNNYLYRHKNLLTKEWCIKSQTIFISKQKFI